MSMTNLPPKRDPREPTPLVLMNPELRVRQLRYAANIEASLMVPLHRYYEVLLDLSLMGLEYLKAMKLERAFIIFKRIEYFIFHRLNQHPGIATFTSASKSKIMARLPMIMYVAQQIIVEFVMPVYERQAAYFRYEELQRRLKILNPTAWQGIMAEAARREAEFYSEAEEISTRFGVELSSFLPQEVVPDDNHPTNYPPRTYPAIPKKSQEATDREAMQAAINAMNQNLERLPINADQPVESLVRNINSMMNDALAKFFNTRTLAMTGQLAVAELPSSSSVDITTTSKSSNEDVILVKEVSANSRTACSPGVEHMYSMPGNLPTSEPYVPPVVFGDPKKRMVYNPTCSLETYVDLLTKTFELNSKTATGFRVRQYTSVERPNASKCASFLLYLDLVKPTDELSPGGTPPDSSIQVLPTVVKPQPLRMIPEPDPGQPRANPPVKPDKPDSETAGAPTFGVWTKKGAARGPDGVGSLGVLSDLDRAREVLDAVPPIPPRTADEVGASAVRKRSNERGSQEDAGTKRKSLPTSSNEPGPSGSTTIPTIYLQ